MPPVDKPNRRGGPYLCALFLCDDVLPRNAAHDALGAFPVIVMDYPGQAFEFRLVAAVARGGFSGAIRVEVDMIEPAGRRTPFAEFRIPAERPEVSLASGSIQIAPGAYGEHWMVGKINGREVTRVPVWVNPPIPYEGLPS